MPDTGFIIAAEATNDTGKGTVSWANPGFVTADDGSNATANLNSNESFWLRSAHEFEQLLPIGSEIVGVEVRAQLSGPSGSVERVIEVQLHNGTEFIGTAKTPNEAIPDSATNLTFGGAEDTWDATLNLIQIGFCELPVQFGFRVDSDGAFKTVACDATWMKIYYLDAARPPNILQFFLGGCPDCPGKPPAIPGQRGDFK